MATGRITTWIVNGISVGAVVTALIVVGRQSKDYEVVKKTLADLQTTLDDHSDRQEAALEEVERRREALAKEIERDRKDYSDRQERRDIGQDNVYVMFGENLSDVNGQVQAIQSKVDSIGGDVAIIKQILMQKPGP
ncbi:MAG: hypothetical protein EHM35_01835 [Planctomycetaceae bacterium]|nr:MAG: hypothetical protein EHM35_01835 [Planctomycetaceae bacterium]